MNDYYTQHAFDAQDSYQELRTLDDCLTWTSSIKYANTHQYDMTTLIDEPAELPGLTEV